MEGEVIEGFICPLCYKDLKSALNLNAHFQDHSQDDQNLFKSVKDIYEKAKKKIRGAEQLPSSSSRVEKDSPTILRRTPGYPASVPNDIDCAVWRTHTARFKAIRDLRNERYVTQTNTLLIRLGKLLLQLPTDPVRRKAYEQEVVPWLNEKDVSLCPGCAKPFNILKRKHHCRLCGSIMCKSCTFLLSLDLARRMVGASPESSSPPPIRSGLVGQKQKILPVQAVQAVLSLEGVTDNDFWICGHCSELLRKREITRQNRSERPIIAQFYERLHTALVACDEAVANYHQVYTSLCAGETKHTVSTAKNHRIDLLRLADTVDLTSKKIAVLGQNTDTPPQGASLKLQQSIRNAAALYLKAKVVSLPSLPSEEEITEYQERRRLEIERRIEEERQKEIEEENIRALEAGEQTGRNQQLGPSNSAPAIGRAAGGQVNTDDGWTPRVKQAIITDDPLLQQIGILHGFIEQAQRAGKEDECAALRKNLMELELALDEREAAS